MFGKGRRCVFSLLAGAGQAGDCFIGLQVLGVSLSYSNVVTLQPEQEARLRIDEMLESAGWVVQKYKSYDKTAEPGVALCEVPLKEGRCDYLLLVQGKAVGVIEAKKHGTTLSTIADQSG